MSESTPPQGGGHKVVIRAGHDAKAEGGGVIGVDDSEGKTTSTQNNFLFDTSGRHRWKRTKQVIALLAGLAMITSVIVISVRTKEMSAPLYTFLRITMALGGAAFAVCIDGFLAVRFKTWLRATGGFAVFVIIFFFPVARPTAATPAPDAPSSTSTATPVPADP